MISELNKQTLKTIDKDGKFQALTTDMRLSFCQSLNVLSDKSNPQGSSAIVTYRGVSRNNLLEKLSSSKSPLDDAKLLNLLFYFGDKAKHFYKYNDTQARSLRWLKGIEDCSPETCKEIFDRIRLFLNSPDLSIGYHRDNPSFCVYFKEDSNSQAFIDSICNLGQNARDYYLYFLHAAGRDWLNNQTVLVSTSSDIEIAKEFATKYGNGFIIYYIIPSPVHLFAITAHELTATEKLLGDLRLPCYRGVELFEEHEYSVRGGLFASRILGAQIIHGKAFVVNPHLFEATNSACNIIDGLKIDQSDFEDKLDKTGYERGVATAFDGVYKTIYK